MNCQEQMTDIKTCELSVGDEFVKSEYRRLATVFEKDVEVFRSTNGHLFTAVCVNEGNCSGPTYQVISCSQETHMWCLDLLTKYARGEVMTKVVFYVEKSELAQLL